jgi:hypothetical protein
MAAAKLPEAAQSKDARTEALMRAIYGDRYLAGPKVGLIEADIPESEADIYAATIIGSTDLPDGRTVVVANGTPSDKSGEDHSAHVSPGLLNVYVLRRDAGGWRVLERHESVDLLGSSGNIGGVDWITLAPGKPGFVISSGGSWQGSTVYGEVVYALDGGRLLSLGVAGGHSDNVGACVPGMDECWEVDGKPRVADADAQPGPYRDILVDFIGRHYTLAKDADDKLVERVKSRVRQSARYHFDGKSYVRVEGEEPLPSI